MIIFEWDDAKAVSNRKKHGIDFDDAARVFSDPYAVMDQDRIVDGEDRWRTIGLSNELLLLYVAHTVEEESSDEIVRIISARPATRKERRRYGQHRQEKDG